MTEATGIAQLGVAGTIVVILLAILRQLVAYIKGRDALIESIRQERDATVERLRLEARADQATAIPALQEAARVMARLVEREAERVGEERARRSGERD